MKTRRPRFFPVLPILAVLSLLFLRDSAFAEEKRKIVPQAKASANLGVETGRYYAIVIGINEYKHLPKLQTAKKDAEDVARILREKFGFETRLLLDATRHEIVDSINQARARLRENDNFLIYYAGHGEFDKTTEKAFWLPADARPDSDAEWIIADTITSNIKRFTAKHILIIADSCYSGTMTRKAVTALASSEERAHHLRKMSQKPSRTLMASGGNEPVADTGGEGHSIFASVFLRALERMEEPAFTAERLFSDEIKVPVSGRAEQTPEYHDIKNSGHDGGDFVFLAKTASLGGDATSGGAIKPGDQQKKEDKAEESEVERKIREARERKEKIEKEFSLTAKMEEMDASLISREEKIKAWKDFIGKYPDRNPKLEEARQKLARLQEGAPAAGGKEKEEDLKVGSLPPKEPAAKPPMSSSLEEMAGKILAAREKKQQTPGSGSEGEQFRAAREQYETGEKYWRRGTLRDYREALKWYRRAADQGYAPAMKKVGDYYSFGWGGLKADAREGMQWYRQAADKGDPGVYAAIGTLYRIGIGGTPKDTVETGKWYQKAAEMGDVEVLNIFGNLYRFGDGVAQDHDEAMRWFKKAAELGSGAGLSNVAEMYIQGSGTPKDPAEGIKWLKKAAESGVYWAYSSIGDAYLHNPEVRDFSEGVKWLKKAADMGYVRAYLSLGEAYKLENRDIAEAMKWYARASELGLGDGYYQIGNMYRFGVDGVARVDYDEAMKWFKKAAEVGDGIGCWAAGSMYKDGHGVARNYGEAVKWYRRAMEDNGAWLSLAFDIGEMYAEGGPGLPKDIEQARSWYRKGADINAYSKERAEKKIAAIK